MDFRQELRALVDRHLDPTLIYSHFGIILALHDEKRRLQQATDKFPEDAEHDEEQAMSPEALKAYEDAAEASDFAE
jgi:hypothetical protein